MHAFLEFKALAAFVLLVIAVAGGLFPLFLIARGVSNAVIRGSNAFAGGVLLAAALVHMLPDAGESLEEVGLWFQHIFVEASTDAFPVAPVVAGATYLLLAMVQLTVHQHISEDTQRHGVPSPMTGHAREPMLQSQDPSASPLEGQLSWPRTCGMEGLQGPAMTVADAEHSCATGKALACALFVHSFLEGFGIGAQTNPSSFVAILIAVGAHKGLAGFALGTELVQGGKREVLWGVGIFGVCSPLGIILGAIVSNNITGPGTGLVMAMSAGTFLYVALPELLIPAFQGLRQPLAKKVVALAVLGFLGMSFLAVWA